MKEFKSLEQKRNKIQRLMVPVFLLMVGLGWFFPLIGYFIPACMIIGIVTGFLKGRVWCSWACPRGSFYDAGVKFLSSQRPMPEILKKIPFKLTILGLLMLIMISNIISVWPDTIKIGRVFVTLLTITTLIGIILGVFFHQRAWCYICPVGTLSGLVGAKKYQLSIDANLCTECTLCSKVCPMQLAPFKKKTLGITSVQENDCVRCDLCVNVCPKEALKR